MRQISGDVIKVITTNEHFPLGGCLVPHWQERLTCFLHIYLDYLQGILKVVKAPCKKRIDQSLTTQGWQRGKCTCSWVMGILTRVWRTFLRGDNKPIFKWLCAWCVGTQSFSCVWLFAAPWTVACQAHLSMGILQTRTLQTRVGCHAFLQGIFLIERSNLCLLHL